MWRITDSNGAKKAPQAVDPGALRATLPAELMLEIKKAITKVMTFLCGE